MVWSARACFKRCEATLIFHCSSHSLTNSPPPSPFSNIIWTNHDLRGCRLLFGAARRWPSRSLWSASTRLTGSRYLQVRWKRQRGRKWCARCGFAINILLLFPSPSCSPCWYLVSSYSRIFGHYCDSRPVFWTFNTSSFANFMASKLLTKLEMRYLIILAAKRSVFF